VTSKNIEIRNLVTHRLFMAGGGWLVTHPHSPGPEAPAGKHAAGAPQGAGGAGAGPPSPGSYHPSEQEMESQDCPFNKKHHEEQEVQEPGLLPRVHIILLNKNLNCKTVPLTKKHHEEQEVQEPGLLPRVHIILLNKK
jgi:hypothetical protein